MTLTRGSKATIEQKTLSLSRCLGSGYRFDVYPRDDAIVVDRSPVTLHCQSRDEDVTRSASSSYEWFLNDESIVNTSANRHEVFANGSLHYETLSMASGPSTPLRYTCKSTRQSGTLVSDVATIRFACIETENNLLFVHFPSSDAL